MGYFQTQVVLRESEAGFYFSRWEELTLLLIPGSRTAAHHQVRSHLLNLAKPVFCLRKGKNREDTQV